ncbi:MAG: zinc ribbon domain-containing protein [Phycisphaerae bacterium]
MGATLEALHRLQEIELQINEIQQRIDRKARVCRRQRQRIAEIDASIESRQQLIHTDQIEADRLDLEAKVSEAEIAKYRNALNTSKTQKEYSAVLTQLNTFKADSGKTEDRVLALLASIDEKKKELEAAQEEREKEVARLEEHEAATRAVEDKTRGDLNRLTDLKKEAASAVPPQVLNIFTRVAGKNDGEALAQIIRTHPKRQEYACGGCNMSITIEQVNSVLSRDEAVLCSVCGRILYAEPHSA